MPDLTGLQRKLEITFANQMLLEQALTHSSYLNENTDLALVSNERLEFLGDAVLGLVVAEKLLQEFPQFTEGQMTKLRAAVVRRDTLVSMAKTIELGNYLILGKGEEASGGRHKPLNLAGAMEAVIAAIFLDQGLASARDFIMKFLDSELKIVISKGTTIDYKSELQELIQAREHKSPTYHLIEAMGPDHNRSFIVEVRLTGNVLGKGTGRSKKEAESEAARSALEKLRANRASRIKST
ncbi:MAG: ribonuclease III [Chloroflexota bacterium]